MWSKYFICNLIATFWFVHVEHFWATFEGIYIIIDNNDKPLIIFGELIKIDELIKLVNQSIQRYTRDRSSRDDINSYFWKQKVSWSFNA